MKAIVQRVTAASVTVDGRLVSSIGKGICVLLGISRKDTSQESEWMARKLLNLRIFENPDSRKGWDRSVLDLGLEVLCVSQFTLCHVMKGNKPDFHNAMSSDTSKGMFDEFLKLLGSQYKPEAVKGGEFGAYMQVHIQNDGPVTIDLESPQFPPPKQRKPQGGRVTAASKDTKKYDQDDSTSASMSVATSTTTEQ